MDFGEVKFAAGGKKLLPYKPLPSRRSPWQRKHFSKYIFFPAFRLFCNCPASSRKGFFNFFNENVLPQAEILSGISSAVGGEKAKRFPGKATNAIRKNMYLEKCGRDCGNLFHSPKGRISVFKVNLKGASAMAISRILFPYIPWRLL